MLLERFILISLYLFYIIKNYKNFLFKKKDFYSFLLGLEKVKAKKSVKGIFN